MKHATLCIAIWIATVCAVLSSCTDTTPRGQDSQPPSRTERGGEVSANRGEKVYQQYCVTCHMANGQGISGVYPPLDGSEFLADKQKTIDAITNGLKGEITVKGKKYNSLMPAIPSSYSNADIAAVVNYVMQTFGKGAWTTTEAEIAAIRKK